MEGGTAVPQPAELLDDINALDKWRIKVDSRSKELKKMRDAPVTSKSSVK
jgi:hypothetical protein